MNGPGMSIFNGGDSIQVNQDDEDLEAEEEELADQLRRKEELHHELQNAFDDLIDDDDTIDNSSNFRSSNNPHNKYYNNVEYPQSNRVFTKYENDNKQMPYHTKTKEIGQGDQLQNTYRDENIKLQQLLDSKSREFEHVTNLLAEERRVSESQINELRKRLALSEAEKERSIMTRQQTHELLVESKAKISDMDDVIDKMKIKMKSMENANSELLVELENAKTMLSDYQHKYHMIERNASGFTTSDRHTDTILKQLNERHNGQIEMMQQQIETFRARSDERELELKNLDIRYKELQRSRECLLVEKSEVINNLAKSLEESQRHCQQLISKPDLSQENIKLKRLVTALEQQTGDMEKSIKTLTQKLEATAAELELMDSVLCENDEQSMTLRRLSSTKRNIPGSTPLPTEDRLAKLKSELYRCMNGQKEKREVIKKLEELLLIKDKEIKQIKEDENKALVQMTHYKEETTKLDNKLKIVERDLEVARKNYRSTHDFGREKSGHEENEQIIRKLEEKNEKLVKQLKELNDDFSQLKFEYDGVKTKYEIISMEKENLSDELTKSKSKSSNETSEISEKILEYERVKFLLNDAQNELDRVKNLYIEMSNSKDELQRELTDLKGTDLIRDLSIIKEKNVSLERAIQLGEIKFSEMSKIIDKEKQEHNSIIIELRDKLSKTNNNNDSTTRNLTNTCSKCVDSITDIAKCEIQNIQLQNACTNYLKEINDLKVEINKLNTNINDLHEKLGVKEERDNLLDELKKKAQQFEELIKSRNNSSSLSKSVSTSPLHRPESRDQSVFTSPELELKATKENEKKIRQELAKSFAIQIKTVEDKFKEQFEMYERTSSQLKLKLQEMTDELDVKTNEVRVLKHAILSERAKMTEIINKKDYDNKLIYERQTEILDKLKNELENSQKKISQLNEELDGKTIQIESERLSMVKVMNQWTIERNRMKDKEQELKNKLYDIEKENTIKIKHLNEKYQSAKKTAINYKNYAEDKEKHMISEYERIKDGYNVALEKVQSRMKIILENQQKIATEKSNKLKSEYDSRLKSLENTLK